MINIIN